jgi:hypothetical protein
MNRPGKVTGNVCIESFFHAMKADIVHGLRFDVDRGIERAVRASVPFDNGTRLHSSLDYVPPATFERLDMTNVVSTHSEEHPVPFERSILSRAGSAGTMQFDTGVRERATADLAEFLKAAMSAAS